MTDSEVVEFTRGVMDRLREYCRKLDPAGWAEIDAAPLYDQKIHIHPCDPKRPKPKGKGAKPGKSSRRGRSP